MNIMMEVGGGEIHILWVSASNHVDRDQTPPKGGQTWVALKEALINMYIDRFSCAF